METEYLNEWTEQLGYLYGTLPETDVNKRQCPCCIEGKSQTTSKQINQ